MSAMDARRHPKDRLVDTAVDLFYREGIHAVGVNRIVSEAGVTLATLYRHFPSKDDLVVAYLDTMDATLRRAVDSQVAAGTREDAVVKVLQLVSRTVCSTGFRGCHFINAAAEYPDPASPVRHAIDSHRRWFHGRLLQLAEAAGHPDPGYAAALCVLLHDGGLSGGNLDDPRTVAATVDRAVRELFGVPLAADRSDVDEPVPAPE